MLQGEVPVALPSIAGICQLNIGVLGECVLNEGGQDGTSLQVESLLYIAFLWGPIGPPFVV